MLTFTEAITEVGKTETRIAKLKNHVKAGYQDHPLGDKQCSSCSMFVPPSECTDVEDIQPSGYCQLYERSDLSQRLRDMFNPDDTAADAVAKQQPSAGDVHATTALGNEGRRRRRKDFLTTIAEIKGGARIVEPADDGDAVGKKKTKTGKIVTVLVVRHGKTKMNNEVDTSQDRIRSWLDVPLVEEGRDEARRTGDKLDKIGGVEAIVSSDLERAKETAGIIGDIIGVKPTFSAKLRPWDLGKFTGKSTKDAMPKIAEYIENKPDEPVPEGESFNDFRKRAFSGLAEAIRKAGGNKLVIVTHHRNERLFNAWDEAGQPSDHSIDLKEFTKKGEPPGAVMELDVDVDALAGKQDDENAVAKQGDDDGINVALHLYPLDGDSSMAKTPFPWAQDALADLRSDQAPRFLAALTDQDDLPVKTISLNSLVAIQNRVDPDKVQSMADNEPDKLPVVVRFNGRNIIADGHHRLAAHLLTGRKTAPVRFADLTVQDNAVEVDKRFRAVVKCPECGVEMGQWHKVGCSGHVLGDVEGMRKGQEEDWSIPFDVVAKVDDQQLVFGWASIASVGGEDVVDKQGDIIPEDELEKAAYDYVLYCRQQGDMHERAGVGRLVESMVFTLQKQAVLNVDLGMVGWFVGFRVDCPETWAKVKSGTLPEFSIGGKAIREEV
jgi:broad specificity phosphatase PhoE